MPRPTLLTPAGTYDRAAIRPLVRRARDRARLELATPDNEGETFRSLFRWFIDGELREALKPGPLPADPSEYAGDTFEGWAAARRAAA